MLMLFPLGNHVYPHVLQRFCGRNVGLKTRPEDALTIVPKSFRTELNGSGERRLMTGRRAGNRKARRQS